MQELTDAAERQYINKKYSYSQVQKLLKEAKTKDEQDFYMALSNIVLQKQQSKIIGK